MFDFELSRAFLARLGSQIEGDNKFTFQSFDDRREKRVSPHIIHGKFDDVSSQLAKLSSEGSGVFVTVNATDLVGRSENNIIRIRAFFIDSDNGFLDWKSFPLQPSIVVNSKRGNHVYWLIKPTNGIGFFRQVQKSLIKKFNTDDKIHDPSRVMRLPGFPHLKGEPELVKIEHESDAVYEVEEFITGMGLSIDEPIPINIGGQPRDGASYDEYPLDYRISLCLSYLNSIGPAIKGSGQGNEKTLSAARVGWDFGVDDESFWPILQRWGNQCDPPWDDIGLYKVFKSAVRGVTYVKGSKLLDQKYRRKNNHKILSSQSYKENDVPWSKFHSDLEANVIEHQIILDEPPEDTVPISEYNAPSAGEEVYDISNGTIVIDHSLAYRNTNKSNKKKKKNNNEDEDDSGGEINGTAQKRKGVSVDDSYNPKKIKYGKRNAEEDYVSKMVNHEYILSRDNSGGVYIYNGKFWAETKSAHIENISRQYTDANTATHAFTKRVADRVLRDNHIPKINWNIVGDREIPINEGLLDFKTGEIRAHDPSHWIDHIIPYTYDPFARCPTWIRCIEEWLPNQPEEQEILQQFFGYCLMPTARYKKSIILYGGPNTGKSQVCSVAEKLVGGNICSISPSDMDDPRKLASIKGKAINIVPDLPSNTKISDGGFKKLVSTGEDAITIDRKYVDAEIYKPTCKHIFATNNLPVISDSSDAVFKRIIILRFLVEFESGKQDAFLQEKFIEEMPGIFSWAVEGAKILYDSKGKWSGSEISNKFISEYKMSQNQIYMFINDSGIVRFNEHERIQLSRFHELFNNSVGRKFSSRKFSEKLEGLSKLFPFISKVIINGNRYVKGIEELSHIKQSSMFSVIDGDYNE